MKEKALLLLVKCRFPLVLLPGPVWVFFSSLAGWLPVGDKEESRKIHVNLNLQVQNELPLPMSIAW